MSGWNECEISNSKQRIIWLAAVVLTWCNSATLYILGGNKCWIHNSNVHVRSEPYSSANVYISARNQCQIGHTYVDVMSDHLLSARLSRSAQNTCQICNTINVGSEHWSSASHHCRVSWLAHWQFFNVGSWMSGQTNLHRPQFIWSQHLTASPNCQASNMKSFEISFKCRYSFHWQLNLTLVSSLLCVVLLWSEPWGKSEFPIFSYYYLYKARHHVKSSCIPALILATLAWLSDMFL